MVNEPAEESEHSLWHEDVLVGKAATFLTTRVAWGSHWTSEASGLSFSQMGRRGLQRGRLFLYPEPQEGVDLSHGNRCSRTGLGAQQKLSQHHHHKLFTFIMGTYYASSTELTERLGSW